MHIAKRENPIVNRLNKTKVERAVDHEQERIDRLKAEHAVRRQAAAEKARSSIFYSLHVQFPTLLTEKSGLGARPSARSGKSCTIVRYTFQC